MAIDETRLWDTLSDIKSEVIATRRISENTQRLVLGNGDPGGGLMGHVQRLATVQEHHTNELSRIYAAPVEPPPPSFKRGPTTNTIKLISAIAAAIVTVLGALGVNSYHQSETSAQQAQAEYKRYLQAESEREQRRLRRAMRERDDGGESEE